jgi:hypothetical protein
MIGKRSFLHGCQYDGKIQLARLLTCYLSISNILCHSRGHTKTASHDRIYQS